MEKAFYRYKEAAEVLACSRDYVGRLVQEGKLLRVFIGASQRSARITRESLQKYVAEIKRKNGSELHSP